MISRVPNEVRWVMGRLGRDHKTYLVGGCVRDLLLNREPKDYDIVTSALPGNVMDFFEHTIPTGIKHGTITVLHNGYPIEVTTMRRDGVYKDSRRPDSVEFTDDLREDVARRDFTINAIAMDIEGKVHDHVKGKKDLRERVVRAVGNPDNRFIEDPLRMMRAKRLNCQLGFSIEHGTSVSIKRNSHLINKISVERVRDELCKILVSDDASRGINSLYHSGLLCHILPELEVCYGFDQCNPNHDKDIFDHTLSVLDKVPKEITIRLAALLHDVAKPLSFSLDEHGVGHFFGHQIIGRDLAETILTRMKFDNNTVDKVKTLVRFHMDRYDSLRSPKIKKFINRVGRENLDDLFELQMADIMGSKVPHDFSGIEDLKEKVNTILNNKEPLTLKDLDINGYDLIQLGFKPGKLLGKVLDNLLDLVLINKELNDKEVLLTIAKYGFDNERQEYDEKYTKGEGVIIPKSVDEYCCSSVES